MEEIMKMFIFYFILFTSYSVQGAIPNTSHKIVKKQYVSYNEAEPESLSQLGDDNNGENGGEMNSYAPANNDLVSSFINNGDQEGEKLAGDGSESDIGSLTGGNMEFEGGNQNLGVDNGASRNVLESTDSGVLNDGDGGSDMSSLSSLIGQDSQQASQSNDGLSPLSLSDDASNSQSSIISSFSDNMNTGGTGDDMLSSFTNDAFGKKFESSVNLGDLSSSNSDLGAIEGLKGNSMLDKLITNGYSVGLPSGASATGQPANSEENKHNSGEAKQGIGNKFEDVQDLLSKEMNQLDSADEKLEKMLENGIDSDTTFSNSDGTNNDGYAMSGPTGGPMNVGTAGSPWGNADSATFNSMQTQMANQYPDALSMDSLSQQLTQHPADSNQNPVGLGSLNQISHKVVYEHASDKPNNAKSGNDHLSQAASKNAANVQMKQKASHQSRLKKLKERLTLLNKKIEELTAEQSKKSSDTGDNNPRKVRNNAIKRLLIKNLKLAALIASKEIQLEETKARSLSSSSERREDSLKANEPVHEDNAKFNDGDFLNVSKPLTELSRKAEEEVNHLKKNEHELSKSIQKDNKTLTASNSTFATSNSTLVSPSNKTIASNSSLKINETLAILDQSGNNLKNKTDNVTAVALKKPTESLNVTTPVMLSEKNSTKVAVGKDKLSTFEKSPAVVGDKGIATLFTEMKQKAAVSAKRRSLLHKKIQKKSKEVKPLPTWD